jgi:hypothetical protein
VYDNILISRSNTAELRHPQNGDGPDQHGWTDFQLDAGFLLDDDDDGAQYVANLVPSRRRSGVEISVYDFPSPRATMEELQRVPRQRDGVVLKQRVRRTVVPNPVWDGDDPERDTESTPSSEDLEEEEES